MECSLRRLPPHQMTHPLTSRLYFPQGAGSGGWLALSLGELKVNILIQAIQYTYMNITGSIHLPELWYQI